MQNIIGNFVCCACEVARDIQDLKLCSCRPSDPERPYYCERFCSSSECEHALDCTAPGHQTCWDSHLPNLAKLRKDHRPASAFYDAVIKIITYSEADDARQNQLHAQDRQAQWLNVNLYGYEDIATLQVSNRFRQLLDPGKDSNAWSSEQYPSFVSFIGDTGVGKSTLVNAMITVSRYEALRQARDLTTDHRWSGRALERIVNARSHGPVTRSANPEHASLPTSSGVHLYSDPTVTKVQYSRAPSGIAEKVPILFADCEGFRGGTTKTNAEQSRESSAFRNDAVTINTRPASSMTFGRGGMETANIQDEMTISAPDFPAGKEGAELFYARFLYAFSDVIVFVTNSEQQLQDDMRRLLEWAASAVKKSRHHRPQKTLIVVRNMPRGIHTPKFYDRSYLKNSLLGSLGNVWEHSGMLADFKRKHDQDSKYVQSEIHSNDDFIRIFFQDVEFCYIPLNIRAPATEVFDQYVQLRNLVVSATKRAQQVRSASWTRYDVPTMSNLLSRAFDHFSRSSEPFDFYTAARKDNPTPVSLPGHIANLLRHMKTSTNGLDSFAKIVAVCLISYVCRNFNQATEPNEIFDKDLRAFCEKGIEIYQTKFQRCAYLFSNQDRCIVVGTVHPDHCSTKNIRVPGGFDASEYREHHTITIDRIRTFFKDWYTRLFTTESRQPVLRTQRSAGLSQLREEILGEERLRRSDSLNIREPLVGKSFWDQLKSNKSCFACLQFAPDHILRCGHGFCEECVKDFGLKSEKYQYGITIDHCVLCNEGAGESGPMHLVHLQPRCAGVRLLTLDGGGVRGIVEIAILEKIEHRVGLGVPIRELFDLIVGTSTGGIISLGLAMTSRSIAEIGDLFIDLATQTFKADRRGMMSWADPFQMTPKVFMLMKIWKSRYSTRPLREGLKQIFGPEQSIFSCPSRASKRNIPGVVDRRSVRVAVTSTSSGQPSIFSNYSRAVMRSDPEADADYLNTEKDFEREDDPEYEARVWEAALATSAAPGFFRKWKIGVPPKPFVDGALHSNLPAPFALEEVERIWPRRSSPKVLDTLVTVGTGIQGQSFSLPSWLDVASLGEVAAAFYYNTVDTESTWVKFQGSQAFDPSRHHRLNVDIKGDYVGLDQWDKMPKLRSLVNDEYYNLESGLAVAIERVSYRLAASLLYFEPESSSSRDHSPHSKSPNRREEVRGQIWCRLPRESNELRRLVQRISGFHRRETHLNVDQPWMPIRMDENWKSQIISGRDHFVVPCVVGTLRPDSLQTIAVELNPPSRPREANLEPLGREKIPISGFPVLFRDLQFKAYSK